MITLLPCTTRRLVRLRSPHVAPQVHGYAMNLSHKLCGLPCTRAFALYQSSPFRGSSGTGHVPLMANASGTWRDLFYKVLTFYEVPMDNKIS